jgi:hypothetical protein
MSPPEPFYDRNARLRLVVREARDMTTRHRIARLFTILVLLGGSEVAHGGVVGTGHAGELHPGGLRSGLGRARHGDLCLRPRSAHDRAAVLPQRQAITADTTIAGGDRISLSGGGTRGLFTVQSGRTLILEHLTLRDGGTENWAVYVSRGHVLVDGVAREAV